MNYWMVRSLCGWWPSWLTAWYITANVGIFTAYVILPIALISGRVKGIQIGTSRQTVLWSLFIFFCGAGHLIENVGSFLVPNYIVFAAWHSLTALISLYTAVTFPKAVMRIAGELRDLQLWADSRR